MTIDMSHVCSKNGIRMRAVRGRTTVPSTIMAGKGFGDQGDEMNESRKAAQLKVFCVMNHPLAGSFFHTCCCLIFVCCLSLKASAVLAFHFVLHLLWT